jgi:hypothetical protein
LSTAASDKVADKLELEEGISNAKGMRKKTIW